MRRTLVVALGASAWLGAGTAAAQQPGQQQQPAAPPAPWVNPDPMLKRIWDEGIGNSQVERLAQALLDSVGPRLTGSPGQMSAHQWAVAQYQAWGIPAGVEPYGTWRGWRRGYTHVDLVQPRVRTLEAIMLAWSPGTNGPVTAPIVILPDVADSAAFQAWLPSTSGKLVMVAMAQPTCRPDDNWEKWARPADLERMKQARTAQREAWTLRLRKTGLSTRDLARALEDAGAAGIFTSNWSAGWGVDKVFAASTLRVPTIDLSCEDYSLVFRMAQNGQDPRVRVDAQSEALGEAPTHNTIAQVRGSRLSDEYVMLSAHFDSWDAASGATDNGTGTVVMMEAMRILRSVYPQPKRTIVAGHWSGEEQGLNGSRAWREDHPEVVEGLQALFNQDNGTGRIVNLSMQGLTGVAPFFRRWFARMPPELLGEIRMDDPGMPSVGVTDN